MIFNSATSIATLSLYIGKHGKSRQRAQNLVPDTNTISPDHDHSLRLAQELLGTYSDRQQIDDEGKEWSEWKRCRKQSHQTKLQHNVDEIVYQITVHFIQVVVFFPLVNCVCQAGLYDILEPIEASWQQLKVTVGSFVREIKRRGLTAYIYPSSFWIIVCL